MISPYFQPFQLKFGCAEISTHAVTYDNITCITTTLQQPRNGNINVAAHMLFSILYLPILKEQEAQRATYRAPGSMCHLFEESAKEDIFVY